MRALLQILVVLLVLVLAVGLGYLIYSTVQWTRARMRRRADRRVPWTHYCRPDERGESLDVGIERVTPDGRVLSRIHLRSVPIDDDLERRVAEGEAQVRAHNFNQSRVGM